MVTRHRSPVTVLRYNEPFNTVISVDTKGTMHKGGGSRQQLPCYGPRKLLQWMYPQGEGAGLKGFLPGKFKKGEHRESAP